MWGLLGVAVSHERAAVPRRSRRDPRLQDLPRRHGEKGARALLSPRHPLMLAVGSSWYVAVAARTPGLLDYFLGTEVYARIATAKHGRNPEWYKPLFIFVPPLLFGAGTAMAAWIVELARNRALFGWASLKRLLRGDERLAFLALWLLVPLVIFSLAKSRLPLYVLPIFPAVALATARMALRAIERPGLARAAIDRGGSSPPPRSSPSRERARVTAPIST